MMEIFARAGKTLLSLLVFLILVWRNGKANLKREYRSRQFPMPVLALIYCVVILVFMGRISDWIVLLIDRVRALFTWLTTLAVQNPVMGVLRTIADKGLALLAQVNPVFLLCIVANCVFLLVHIFIKRILLAIFKRVFKNGGAVHRVMAGWFYEYDEQIDRWCVKKHYGQARTYIKTFYIAGVIISIAAVLVSAELFRRNLLSVPFYPVFGILILGEVYFFLNGLTQKEQESMLSGEDDSAVRRGDYTLLRKALRKVFGDKLGAENTTYSSPFENSRSNDELITRMENSEQPAEEAYGLFMRRKSLEGLDIDQNYMQSGLDLLSGKSILFSNPFYYDLIPYVFYAMNRELLQHRKILIVLGRHETEKDIAEWCEQGFLAVNNVPAIWRIGVLNRQEQDLDVGILSRSAVQDLPLHAANAAFFSDVDFVVLIEPSRLVATAQIGLNSIVRYCRNDITETTFCSADKNCDGLVDALSHILMTNLTEVSATNRPKGTSSYMCWQTDNDLWQHRLLPNITRNLGIGTELSLVALKNQVSKTDWYGGDVFPVVDAHWIAKQYYYDLLHYAELTPSQDKLDEVFRVSPNLWNAKTEKRHYMTVEDEYCNLFEVRRAFATRATEQGFINIISPEYLLREYMIQNEDIFATDPKAIPYIVADYARTARNVILRLFLRMSVGNVPESDVRQELNLLDVPTDDLRRNLWHELCVYFSPVGGIVKKGGHELLECTINGKRLTFTESLILVKKKFSLRSGKMENNFYIEEQDFAETILHDLKNAEYIAESDQEGQQYLGTELYGQIFQKYLPGQFFTFGGKYYEMLRVTKTGKILVRRAADHIKGRPAYRQVRRYTIRNVADSQVMGDNVTIVGMRIARQYADVTVQTPGYWQLDSYQDFAHGREIKIAGIPERVYLNKQILRIELPDPDGSLTPEIRHTLTVLFNEIFRTIFADNQGLIAAVGESDPALPLTYSLAAEGVDTDNCIYIIEDSLMDVGLLEAVMRNLSKIFSIADDFLRWHEKALEESLHPAPAAAPPDYTIDPKTAEEETEKEPRTKLGRFLKKLFCRKKKKKAGEEETKGPKKKKEKKAKKEKKPKKERGKKGKQPAAEAPQETAGGDAVKAAAPEAKAEGAKEPEKAQEAPPALQLVSAPRMLFDEKPSAELPAVTEEKPAAEAEEPKTEQEAAAEEPKAEPAQEAAEEPKPDGEKPEEDIRFEEDKAEKAAALPKRKPYHERYFLLYGGTEVPSGLDIPGTGAYLDLLGFCGGELEQARKGTKLAELIERGEASNRSGGRYCDFCGAELVGTEYEVLADGRERCNNCSRSAVKTADEFKALFREVLRNMETFYGIEIHAPIRVEMVNAKKLHRRLGKSFVPTGNADGRTLGVAIRDKSGYSLLVENGAPRMQSVMTMAHELTHIWQYLNWDAAKIVRLYGKKQELEIYEGMAKWVEIQYAWLVNEAVTAKREEIITCARKDEYGQGFKKYLQRYPLSHGICEMTSTPFEDPQRPL